MKTSELVAQLGLYYSSCCVEEVVFVVNERFSRCPKCERLCGWEFVERVYSTADMERPELLAA